MNLNNFKITLRLIVKNKTYSLLNILGLSVGLSCCLIIFLYLQNAYQYDKHHINHQNLYRIGSYYNFSGKEENYALSSDQLAPLIKEEYSEIKAFVRFRPLNKKVLLQFDETRFYEEDILLADSNAFAVFTHQFLEGNPWTCLKDPNRIVLTESLSKKLFGSESALGKVLIYDNKVQDPVTVSAVIKDNPPTSHMKFQALVSYATIESDDKSAKASEKNTLWNPTDYSFILVENNFNPEAFVKNFDIFYKKHMVDAGHQLKANFKPVIEPLTDIHFGSNLSYDIFPNGNKTYLIAFTFTGFLILVLAILNYVNMAIAKSASRTKEIGIKKILGASNKIIISDFITESIIFTAISFILSVIVVKFILSYTSFNNLLGNHLEIEFLSNHLLLLWSVFIVLFTGIASGLYPAIFLSNMEEIDTIRSKSKSGSNGVKLNEILVTVQFAICIGVVICALIINNQISYIRNKDLGFGKENILVLPMQDSLIAKNSKVLKASLSQNPKIVATSTSQYVLGQAAGRTLFISGDDLEEESDICSFIMVGNEFIKTMNITVVEGRDFLPNSVADQTGAFLVNEAAVKGKNWKDPLGKGLKFGKRSDGTYLKDGKIVGVVKDFHLNSLHKSIDPLVIMLQDQEEGNMLVKLDNAEVGNTVEFIKERWNDVNPQFPFDFHFLESSLDKLYSDEYRQVTLITILSYICVFISYIGLFSLFSFTISKKTKEIAIRKILGASTTDIIIMLFKSIGKVIIIASLIAMPLAYYAIDKWLQSFAYKTDISIYIFIATGIAALALSLAIVSLHSIRIAKANPIKSIKEV